MSDDILRYSDLIEDDGALDRLIDDLTQINGMYRDLAETIKGSASKMAGALNGMSGATQNGRKSIDEAEKAAEKLEAAIESFRLSASETGKAIAILKAETSANNRATVENYRSLTQAAGSYNKLKAELKEMVGLYKSLSAQEREHSNLGSQALAEIIRLSKEVRALDHQMRIHKTVLTETQKAEERLNFLMSDEGKYLLELKKKIRELTSHRKQQASILDKVAMAQMKLGEAKEDSNVTLKQLNYETRMANREALLTAKVNATVEGSYDNLAAQYELTKFRLKQMNLETKSSTEEFQDMMAKLRLLHDQMKEFQEATGNHTLSVGNYAKVWDGLGYSVAQVVREIPNAAIDMRTFFIAISNNIPILVDEINRVVKKNEDLRRESKETIPVIQQIGKALFSWNTVIAIVLTLLNMFGDDIIRWAKNLIKGRDAAMSTTKAMKNIAAEIESSNDSYGDNISSLRRLQAQWSELKTEAEKTKWIEDNKDAFEDLNLAVNDVNDAERILKEETEAVEEAFRLRAKAAAAGALAVEEYEKALAAESQAEASRMKKAEKLAEGYNKRRKENWEKSHPGEPMPEGYLFTAEDFMGMINRRASNLDKEAEAANRAAEAYTNMQVAYEGQAQSTLEAAGISEYQKEEKEREGRDVTDRVYRARNEAIKKFEASQTALIREEYDRRKKELNDKNAAEIAALEEVNRKSWEILQDKSDNYKDLTEEERQAIVATIEANNATILNMEEQLDYDLQQLAIDRKIGGLKVLEDANKLQLQAVKEGSQEEFDLRKESIEHQKQMELLENSKLEKSVQQQEVDIIAKYNKMLEDLTNERNIALEEAAIRGVELRLQAAKEGSDEEYELQLELLNKQETLETEKNKMLDKSLRVEEDLIKDSYARRKRLLLGQYQLGIFKQAQTTRRAEKAAGPSGNKWSKRVSEYDLGVFDLEQEIALLNYQIGQAKQGLLEWDSDKIAEAEATVELLNRDLADMKSFLNLIAKEGIGGGILMALGFDEDSISAMQDAGNIIIEQLQAIAEAEVEAAEKAVEAAQERADAARSAYEAEIEARNNGYANNVATAKKELELEKKNQMQKQKELEKAQRNQERIDSAMQASSLITATANLLASYSKLGPLGSALSIAAIAAMWGTFIAAKVKAANVTSQKYGEGGLEILEGGSHASGNDIDMGMTNSRGRAMRAEGGEAVAIINRRNTRKYRKALPDIIDSLNKGYFEDKYLNSLNTGGISLSAEYGGGADLTRLESSVDDIKRQGETRYYSHDGYLIVQHRNVKRIIKN